MDLMIKDVGEYLKGNGIKPSYQRIKIFEYLMNTKAHPTVDTIYRHLVKEIPTLSKTTVYNTLNLFIESEIALLITIEENESRYAADTSVHGHFKCERCESVVDFKTEQTNIAIGELADFQINQQHIYFKGICAGCVEETVSQTL